MGKSESEAIRKAVARKEVSDVRKQNLSKFFVNFSRPLVELLKVLVAKYKASGEWPIHPMLILPSYYTDAHDRELAAFAAMLLPHRCRYESISAFRKMLGKHPWEWFMERGFVPLSLGSVQNKRTAGIDNWRIARFFDAIYQEMTYVAMQRGGLSDGFMLYDVFYGSVLLYMCSFASAVKRVISDECVLGDVERRVRLLLFVLGRSDGFSLGLWPIAQMEVKCPIVSGMVQFMKGWFPDYGLVGSIDRAIELFGFESEGDFLYAFLAWEWLCGKDPKGCGRYATAYMRWYLDGRLQMPYKWKAVLPDLTCI